MSPVTITATCQLSYLDGDIIMVLLRLWFRRSSNRWWLTDPSCFWPQCRLASSGRQAVPTLTHWFHSDVKGVMGPRWVGTGSYRFCSQWIWKLFLKGNELVNRSQIEIKDNRLSFLNDFRFVWSWHRSCWILIISVMVRHLCSHFICNISVVLPSNITQCRG